MHISQSFILYIIIIYFYDYFPLYWIIVYVILVSKLINYHDSVNSFSRDRIRGLKGCSSYCSISNCRPLLKWGGPRRFFLFSFSFCMTSVEEEMRDLPMHELRRGQPARGMAAHEGGWGLPCWLTGGIGRWVIAEEKWELERREEKEKTHSGGGGRGRRELKTIFTRKAQVRLSSKIPFPLSYSFFCCFVEIALDFPAWTTEGGRHGGTLGWSKPLGRHEGVSAHSFLPHAWLANI